MGNRSRRFGKMSGWRTNRRTRNKFPVEENRWGQKIENEIPEPEQEIEEESGKGVNVVATCSGCGKPLYEGAQMYEIENSIICVNCNRIDSKLERAEKILQAQQPINPVPYVSGSPYASGSGKHRGGSPSCSKCGHVYSPGESHEDHWRLHPQ